ncbi:rhamnulokinase [Paenibacillus sp. sptzw28]|uniref:rhamnulokinase n=1 Tax=Paenibacillus sp. sptzw28 TaxID=715179 RepID=UPI001C6E5796|nr:rhamnulokinase [Paenibacillus sp. sptzw28]QYR21788.1 rhamnulokinase [Paenibacillus sp. sptzw28]
MGVLAFDLGASSGRAVAGRLNCGLLTIEEIHRFSNIPVQLPGHLHWDILNLFREIKQGLLKSRSLGYPLQSVAIDTWALDFGLIDRKGELLGNPYHYRDGQTEGMMDQVFEVISREEIFSRTGIQFMPVNTLYHLFAMKRNRSHLLEQADRFLMIPDLLRYFLTGEAYTEYTNATTTQLFHAGSRTWDTRILGLLDIPAHLFGSIIQPAAFAGTVLPSISKELSLPPLPVIAACEHDTASAVVAVPTVDRDFAYISCGTWSLMGTELSEPLLSPKALGYNFTNEGGIGGTYRFLKNIMGLWILQECRRIWEQENKPFTFPDLIEAATHARPLQAFIDPDHLTFLRPDHMPEQIMQYCRDTKQPVPHSEGEIVRCIMESLALKYRMVLEMTEELTGKKFKGLHIVGGGSHNSMLCQFTANAIARPVWAGPAEATAIGNIIVQYMAHEQIGTVREAREIVKKSFPLVTYEPDDADEWNDAYARYRSLIG